MDAKQLIDINRKALSEAEAQGLKSIGASTLHEIFNNIEEHLGPSQPSPIELEKLRSDLEGSLAYQNHVHSWNLEGFRQVIALGQSTLQSIMLINGGAAVALLAFLGNLINNKSKSVSLLPFADAMQAFVIGVFLAAAAYAITYLSQLAYDGQKKWQHRIGFGLHVVAAMVATGALVAFLCGSNMAYSGFVSFRP
ncbi:hypothetical protein IEQ11_16005 [Lysobacter capsici]|uniref:hypothetical protein n=1 Tax=Lysobacter capsici TaxID=435897 RepID=UPI001784FEAC|nr:hypothetical protein [Lysobacter capsici]UOF13248.1 hypothetical protein IEQ11_16005 [Lysobacter capsici]